MKTSHLKAKVEPGPETRCGPILNTPQRVVLVQSKNCCCRVLCVLLGRSVTSPFWRNTLCILLCGSHAFSQPVL